MLKNIPSILPPELLKILMEMGHGNEIVIGDGNFPAADYAQRLVRCDGHGVPEIMEAILKLMPLDTYVDAPLMIMQLTPADRQKGDPEIWKTYKEIAAKYEPDNCNFQQIERFEFYERAKKAYCVVATGEKAVYANIILKKGVVIED